MHKFQLPVVSCEDVNTGQPLLGLVTKDMEIHSPFLSACGRFEVSPTEAHGIGAEDAQELVRLNNLIAEAAEAALNAGCALIQTNTGIATGDFASMFFSDKEESNPLAAVLRDYLLAEIKAEADAGS